MVAKLLNRYLDMLSQVVLDHGGVIDKFVGDAVVAFWGAPIARPDDGERAARAGYAIWQAGEEFRNSVEPGLPPIGKTRVGLHCGEAVVGNFGGKSRIQYTALGDSHEHRRAARGGQQGARFRASWRAASSPSARGSTGGGRWAGSCCADAASRSTCSSRRPTSRPKTAPRSYQAMILVDTDRQAAIEVIAGLAEKHPDDAALANLLERTST